MADGEPTARSKLTWMAPLALAALLALLYFAWPDYRRLVAEGYRVLRSGEQQQISEWVKGFGAWGPVAIVLFAVAQTVLAFIPSTLIMVIAVLSYGAWLGGALAWAASLLAAAFAYGVGRAFGPVTVGRLVGGRSAETMAGWVERYGFWGVIAARVSPVISTDAVGLAAGLAAMGLPRFLLATALGLLPLTVLVAYLGEEIERLETGLIGVSVASLVLFVGWVVYDRRKHQRKERRGEREAPRQGQGRSARSRSAGGRAA